MPKANRRVAAILIRLGVVITHDAILDAGMLPLVDRHSGSKKAEPFTPGRNLSFALGLYVQHHVDDRRSDVFAPFVHDENFPDQGAVLSFVEFTFPYSPNDVVIGIAVVPEIDAMAEFVRHRGSHRV